MEQSDLENEAQVLQAVIAALTNLDPATRGRIIRTVVTFYSVALSDSAIEQPAAHGRPSHQPGVSRVPEFGSHPAMSPKEFLLEKSPQTDVERVVCLAYYLAHYRDTAHFKTGDISKLNTEAAQRKLANAAYSINHAVQSGYIVPAAKNSKQLSAMGERFVEALPNREAAKELRSRMRPRKSRKKSSRREKGEPSA